MTTEMDSKNEEGLVKPDVAPKHGGPTRRDFLNLARVGTAAILQGAILAGCVQERLDNPTVTPTGVGPRPSEVPTGVSNYEGIAVDNQNGLILLTAVGRATSVAEYQGSQAIEAGVYQNFLQQTGANLEDTHMAGFEVQTEQNKRAYVFLLVNNKGTEDKTDDTVYMAFKEYKDSQGQTESVDFITDDNWVNGNFTFVELSHEVLPDGTPSYLIRGADSSVTAVVVNKDGSVNYVFFTKGNKEIPMDQVTTKEISFLISAPKVSNPTLEPTLEPIETPKPQILGIDKPIEVGGDVTMQFYKNIRITDTYNLMATGEKITMAPGIGYTFLVFEGEYAGNPYTLVDEQGQWLVKPTFYLEGGDWPKYKSTLTDWTEKKIQIAISIRSGDQGPFILHNALLGWEIDLTPFLETSTPTPSPQTLQ